MRDPAVVDGVFRLAMVICPGLLLAGPALCLVSISGGVLAPTPAAPTALRPRRTVHCAVDGLPTEIHR